MLHLFYVYSNILARMTPPVIAHLNLSPKDIIIVTDRSQSANHFVPRCRTTTANLQNFQPSGWELFKHWKLLCSNRRRISELAEGKPFIAYLPSPSDPVCQQIIHHPLCKSYFLLEEGFGAYAMPGESPARTSPVKWRERLRIGYRIKSLWYLKPVTTDYPLWNRKYAGCFGSCPEAFPGFPAPVVNLQISLHQPQSSNIQHLLVIDDFSVFNKSLRQAYIEVLKALLQDKVIPGQVWAYKLHPRCETWRELADEIELLFKDAGRGTVTPVRLGPDDSVEETGLNTNTITYGYLSVAMYYIHKAGGEILSLWNAMEAADAGFQKIGERLFPKSLMNIVRKYPMWKPSADPKTKT